ncbi:MAG: hypothetical protein ACR2RF_23420 [Geminicoccaceae bacterium]
MAVTMSASLSLPAFGVAAAVGDAGSGPIPLFLGRFEDWTIWEVQGNEHRICYMITGLNGRENSSNFWPALFVTVKPGKHAQNEVSIRSKKIASHDGALRAEIGARRFPLFKRRERAWLKGDEEDEKELLKAMRKGLTMTVRDASKKTGFAESFSLIGFTKAEEALPDICSLSAGRT